MVDVQSLYESKLSMVQGRIDAKRARALGASRSFGAVYANAVRVSEPELIRYRAPDKAETPNVGEPGPDAYANANARMNAAQAERYEQRLEQAEQAQRNERIGASASSSSSPTIAGANAYDAFISEMSAKYGVDANLIKSVMKSESNFNTKALSSAGAMGLMQLMPGTAKEMGVTDPYDPAQNIEGGVKYLRKMLERFNGDVALALAAYNCGPNRVEGLGITSSANTEQFSRLAGNVQRYAVRVLERAGYTLGDRV